MASPPLWRKKHDNLYQKPWTAMPSQSHWNDDFGQCFPSYLLLPHRERELLDMLGIRFPDDRKLIINTAQSDASVGEGFAPCINPGGAFWMAWQARQMHGKEAMALQDMWLSELAISMFRGKFLHEFAGNAFATPACSAARAATARSTRI